MILIGSNSVAIFSYLTIFQQLTAIDGYKQKTPHKQGFSTVELRRGRDSNPRRGYKPLTHLAGKLPRGN